MKILFSFRKYNFNNTKSTTKNSTTRIVQRKTNKVPNNTKSTTKLSHITELAASFFGNFSGSTWGGTVGEVGELISLKNQPPTGYLTKKWADGSD